MASCCDSGQRPNGRTVPALTPAQKDLDWGPPLLIREVSVIHGISSGRPPVRKKAGTRGDQMHVWMIIGGVVVAGIVVVTIAMIPDIVRYIKIKSM
jgi:hypothetical protein